ncbi:MAG: RDD family protein [Alphaproteobacteria bacterium]|nr:MAG: RDD family protein [Alphaproteobacteria bacterium]
MADTSVHVGFGKRFLAMLIDGVLYYIILTVLAMVFGVSMMGGLDPATMDPNNMEANMDAMAASMRGFSLLGLVLMTAYFLGFWILKGATPGKLALGLRIVDADSHGAPDTMQLVKRFILFVIGSVASLVSPTLGIVGLIFIVSCLWVLFDENKQALHDKLGGTAVISTR